MLAAAPPYFFASVFSTLLFIDLCVEAGGEAGFGLPRCIRQRGMAGLFPPAGSERNEVPDQTASEVPRNDRGLCAIVERSLPELRSELLQRV